MSEDRLEASKLEQLTHFVIQNVYQMSIIFEKRFWFTLSYLQYQSDDGSFSSLNSFFINWFHDLLLLKSSSPGLKLLVGLTTRMMNNDFWELTNWVLTSGTLTICIIQFMKYTERFKKIILLNLC